MGIHGKVENYKNILDAEHEDEVAYLEALRKVCKEGRDLLDDSELESDMDSILSLIDSTLYQLKELKESRKSLKNYLSESLNVNEAKKEAYTVAFTDFVDEDGVPITTTIYVPKEYKTEFEKYLQNEVDNTIYNAEGYTNNWELDR